MRIKCSWLGREQWLDAGCSNPGAAGAQKFFSPRQTSGAGLRCLLALLRGYISGVDGSSSCCAAVRGSTNLTTAAPPTGTATIRATSTPTSACAPAVPSPQHPSPSEPVEGIPPGALEGSRPVPVIGTGCGFRPLQVGCHNKSPGPGPWVSPGLLIRTAPENPAMALGLVDRFSFSLSPTPVPL